MTLTDRLREYISAAFTGIWIQSFEHHEALVEIARLCREQKWALATWDIDRGLQAGSQAASTAADPVAAIRSLSALAKPDSSALLVLPNFHRFLQSTEIVQALSHQIQQGKTSRRFIVIISPVVQIPVELEKSFVVIEHDLPHREQLEQIAAGTRHEAFQRVTSLKNQIVSYWKGMSLPYPEPGMRLIKQNDVEGFSQRLTQFQVELSEAVENLDEHFGSLKAAARERLGSLYNPADYPASLRGLFAVDFDFPSIEPPEYLLRLNPQLYEQERQRMSARFEEAVKLAEEAFTAEFARLVSHLTERLTAGVDGEKKVFRDSAIGNLNDFFERFKNLSVRSNGDLERLVETAKQTLSGVEADAVRNSESLRQHLTTQLSTVQATLDDLLVDQPRRRILRSAPSQAGR